MERAKGIEPSYAAWEAVLAQCLCSETLERARPIPAPAGNAPALPIRRPA